MSIERKLNTEALDYLQMIYERNGYVENLANIQYMTYISIRYTILIFDLFQPFIYILTAITAYLVIFNDTELQQIGQSRKQLLQVLLLFIATELLLDTLIVGVLVFDDYPLQFLPIPLWFFQTDLLSKMVLSSFVLIPVTQAMMVGVFSVVIMLAISYFRTANWGSLKFSPIEVLSIFISIVLLFVILQWTGEFVGYAKYDYGVKENIGETYFIKYSTVLFGSFIYLIIISKISTGILKSKALQLKVKQYRSYQLVFMILMLLGRYLAQLFIFIHYSFINRIPSFTKLIWLNTLAVVHDVVTTLMDACLLMVWMRPSDHFTDITISGDKLYSQAAKVGNSAI